MGLPLEKLPDWPASLDRTAALAYSGVAEKTLRAYEKAGIVTFKAQGPHGALITHKTQLDRMLGLIFEMPDGETPPAEDMEFS